MLAAKGMRFPIDLDFCVHPLVRSLSAQLPPLRRNDCQERGICVDHSSINRWAIRFVPLLEKVFYKHKRPVGGSPAVL